MKKKLGIILLIICLVAGSGYLYISGRVTDPFAIDISTTTSEAFAASLISTKQIYSFRLENVSDKSINLIKMQLEGYDGIEIGPITVNGKAFSNLVVPSQNQGIEFEYPVTIQKSKIINPQKVIVTYKYLGIQHQQTVQLPGLKA